MDMHNAGQVHKNRSGDILAGLGRLLPEGRQTLFSIFNFLNLIALGDTIDESDIHSEPNRPIITSNPSSHSN